MKNRMLYFNELYKHVKKLINQIDRVVEVAKKRHPYEDWFGKRIEIDGRISLMYSSEFLQWLKEVYYNPNGLSIDREIQFYENRIKSLVEEFEVKSIELKFSEKLLKDLPRYFNKDRSRITRSVKNMRLVNERSFEYVNENGYIVITKEGIEWLAKNYFKRLYLKHLEQYKRELQNIN